MRNRRTGQRAKGAVPCARASGIRRSWTTLRPIHPIVRPLGARGLKRKPLTEGRLRWDFRDGSYWIEGSDPETEHVCEEEGN